MDLISVAIGVVIGLAVAYVSPKALAFGGKVVTWVKGLHKSQ